MATLNISDSYSDRALVLVAALAGLTISDEAADAKALKHVAITATAGGAVRYVSAAGADAVTEPSVVAKALAAGTSLLPAHTSSSSALVTQWLLWAFSPAATGAEALTALNDALAASSYVAGPRFTVADAVVYYIINPALHALGGGALKHTHLARWLDQVLHERGIGGATAVGVPAVPPVAAAFKRAPLNLFAAPAAASGKSVSAAAPAPAAASGPKAKGKEEKAAAAPAAAGAAAVPAPAAAAAASAPAKGGAGAAPAAAAAAAPAEKKEKASKGEAKPKADAKGAAAAAAEPASAEPIAVCDLRVGHIVKIWPHPEAERLFCEEIDGTLRSFVRSWPLNTRLPCHAKAIVSDASKAAEVGCARVRIGLPPCFRCLHSVLQCLACLLTSFNRPSARLQSARVHRARSPLACASTTSWRSCRARRW